MHKPLCAACGGELASLRLSLHGPGATRLFDTPPLNRHLSAPACPGPCLPCPFLADAAKTAVAEIETKADTLEDAGMDEDEAAEILSAMLGLTAPEGAKKKARKSGGAKVRRGTG